MRNRGIWQRVLLLVLIGVLLFIVVNSTLASSRSGYAIDWFEINSGAVLVGNGFRLTGIAGQADAGVMNGSSYKLGGGFFAYPSREVLHRVFLPLVLRNP